MAGRTLKNLSLAHRAYPALTSHRFHMALPLLQRISSLHLPCFVLTSHCSQEGDIAFPCYCGMWVLRSQLLLTDGKRTLQQRLRLLILVLVLIEHCQIVEAACRVRVLRSQLLLTDGKRTLQQRLRLLILALCSVELCQIVETACSARVLWHQLLLTDRKRTLV